MDVRGSPERKALSILSNQNAQTVPVSPTANLKLLTSVASELGNSVPSAGLNTKSTTLKDSDSKTRKDKSLGILCDKFLAMFPLNLPIGCDLLEICLDRVSQQLGIVKRRIYDIINILESLQMASKVAKNRYYWHGCQNLEITLSQLKAVGLKCGLDVKLQEVQTQQKGGGRLVTGPACCHFKSLPSVQPTPAVTDHEYPKTDKQSPAQDDFFCDERSLGVMCQKFIMLFLVSPQCGAIINLDLATRMLVSEAAESASERKMWGSFIHCHKDEEDQYCSITSRNCRCLLRLKTKVRRLYDIANVLTSLGIIAKMENPPNSMRKPVFYYTGPVVEAATFISSITSVNLRQSLLSSFIYDDDVGMENKEKLILSKRKINLDKGGPPEKFPRTSSETALDEKRRRSEVLTCKSMEASNCLQFKSSLLQVAEQEFEKLCSKEELSSNESISSVRKKLSFTRCLSDSCIQSQSHTYSDLQSQNTEESKNIKVVPEGSGSKLMPSSSNIFKKSLCITVSDLKSKRFTITRKLVEVPSHMHSLKHTEEIRGKKLKMQGSVIDSCMKFVCGKKTPESNQGMTTSTSSDVLNNNKPASLTSSRETSVAEGRSGSGFVSTISSGDLFQAVKVGNVLRLVPLHSLKSSFTGTSK